MACVVHVGNQDPNSAKSHVPPGCWTDIHGLGDEYCWKRRLSGVVDDVNSK
ncbi:hypothetical protein ACLOJK_041439 [Asimina triloba]